MVLVVGATGVLGRKVIGLLLADGQRVRALTRRPESARDLEQRGVDVVQGDLTNPSTLARACAGARRVLAAAHSLLGRGKYQSIAVDDRGHRALIDAARSEGVERFVYVSALGARSDHPIDFIRTKWAIERYLERSGLDYVILRPSAFMEWHAHAFNGASILRNGATTLLGSGTKKRNFVAAQDVARLAVQALTDSTARDRIVEIGGPGNFTNNEVAALYGELAAITPRVRHLPPGLLMALSTVARPFHPGMSRVFQLHGLPDEAFDERFDANPLQAECSFRLTPLRAFVDEQVSLHRGGPTTPPRREDRRDGSDQTPD